jgi:hypothetical protein
MLGGDCRGFDIGYGYGYGCDCDCDCDCGYDGDFDYYCDWVCVRGCGCVMDVGVAVEEAARALLRIDLGTHKASIVDWYAISY